jgi:DNA-directed RNA polymerase subunit alpha
MDITIGHGRGYTPAEDLEDPELPIGTIPVDAIFSPILKVNYEVENMRVGRRTDFERLDMEVWTDGSIDPEMAVSHAAKILKDHYLVFMAFEEEPEEEVAPEIEEESLRIHELLKMPVEELELSVRSANCLRAANIKSIGDLVQKTESEMLKYRNFGRKSLSELADILHEMGLHLDGPALRYGHFPVCHDRDSGGRGVDDAAPGQGTQALPERFPSQGDDIGTGTGTVH